ncbi:hypothetical protein Nmel_013156 [Mimus melanotis]
MLKSIEAAAPKQRYVKINQGPREPFLQFVEKVAAALEKQIENDTLRQLLRKQLVRDNANIDCAKIIQALPGDPSLTDMIQACVNVDHDHEISTLAAAMWYHWKMSGGGQQKQEKNKGENKQKPQQQKADRLTFLCTKCKKPGHYVNQCKSKKPTAGQGNGVIDADLCYGFYAMSPVTIPAGTRIFQLVPFLHLFPGLINEIIKTALDETRLPRAKVFIRDLTMNKWEGPRDLIVLGRGYACVSTDTGVRWLPARCVHPDLQHQRQNVANAQPSNADQCAYHQPNGPSTSRG